MTRTFVGFIRTPVDGESRMDALLNLAEWAEKCVQRVSGTGMNTKAHSVRVEGFGLERNGEFTDDWHESAYMLLDDLEAVIGDKKNGPLYKALQDLRWRVSVEL